MSRAMVLALLVAAAACDDSDGPTPPGLGTAGVRVVNATQQPLDVLVNNQVAVRALPAAGVTATLPIDAGLRQVGLVATGGTGASAFVSLTLVAGGSATAIARPSQTGIAAVVLADTGAIVPAGKTKLRVSHQAYGRTDVLLRRTQPDFATPVAIMSPFLPGETSPYLQSDPGRWEVLATDAGGAVLARTGDVVVPAGERRTVVLLDSAGVLRLRVIAE